jgi:hypothetical protein
MLAIKMTSDGRGPQNIRSGIYQHHLLDHTQILNLSLKDQTIFSNTSNENELQWKTTSKY